MSSSTLLVLIGDETDPFKESDVVEGGDLTMSAPPGLEAESEDETMFSKVKSKAGSTHPKEEDHLKDEDNKDICDAASPTTQRSFSLTGGSDKPACGQKHQGTQVWYTPNDLERSLTQFLTKCGPSALRRYLENYLQHELKGEEGSEEEDEAEPSKLGERAAQDIVSEEEPPKWKTEAAENNSKQQPPKDISGQQEDQPTMGKEFLRWWQTLEKGSNEQKPANDFQQQPKSNRNGGHSGSRERQPAMGATTQPTSTERPPKPQDTLTFDEACEPCETCYEFDEENEAWRCMICKGKFADCAHVASAPHKGWVKVLEKDPAYMKWWNNKQRLLLLPKRPLP